MKRGRDTDYEIEVDTHFNEALLCQGDTVILSVGLRLVYEDPDDEFEERLFNVTISDTDLMQHVYPLLYVLLHKLDNAFHFKDDDLICIEHLDDKAETYRKQDVEYENDYGFWLEVRHPDHPFMGCFATDIMQTRNPLLLKWKDRVGEKEAKTNTDL